MQTLIRITIAKNKIRGFTLLEILVALFIFSILSMILASSLRTVINAQTGTRRNAEAFTNIQWTLLLFSRELTQAINRPVINAYGKEEAAFIGKPHEITFTHAGFANPDGVNLTSFMQRTRYVFNKKNFSRIIFNVLDRANEKDLHKSYLLTELDDVSFQYLDSKGEFHDDWPLNKNQALPQAVKITLMIPNRGKLTQLYVIPSSDQKKESN